MLEAPALQPLGGVAAAAAAADIVGAADLLDPFT